MTSAGKKCLVGLLGLTLTALCGTLLAQAARVERASGELRVRSGQVAPAAGTPLAVGQTVNEGDDIVTEKGTAVLRFPDGQTVAVAENSILRIAAYRFDTSRAENSVSSINLLRGALRMLTGLIGVRNPAAVKVKSGIATIGIRGTDFITALEAVGPGGEVTAGTTSFTQVLTGAVDMTTPGGSLLVDAGQVGSAVGSAAPVASSVAAMSGVMAGQLGQLQGLNLAGGAAGGASNPGASSASAAASGGVSGAVVSGVALTLGLITAIGGGSSNTGTSGTSGTTGTR